jgi:hypothetical protein
MSTQSLGCEGMLHTPAPWNYDRGVVDADPPNGTYARVTICERVYGAVGSPDMVTAEANGNLIAAAPELLAALKGAVKFLVNSNMPGSGDAYRAAVDALAQAGLK